MSRSVAPRTVLAMIVAFAAIVLVPRSARAQQQSSDTQRTAAFVTVGAGALVSSVGVVFAALAGMQAARLEELAAMRDPMSGLPLVNYSDVQAVESQRAVDTGLAIGFFAAGGIAIVTGTVLVLFPQGRARTSMMLMPAPFGGIFRATF